MTLKRLVPLALFRTWSLQFEIQRTVMGIFLVLVLLYNTALGFYFTAGLDIANRVGLQTVAQTCQQPAQAGAENSLLMKGEFSASYAYEDLPEHVRLLFPRASIIPGLPEIKLNNIVMNSSGHLVFLLAESLPNGGTLFLTKELDAEGGQISHGVFSLDFLEHAVFWSLVHYWCWSFWSLAS